MIKFMGKAQSSGLTDGYRETINKGVTAVRYFSPRVSFGNGQIDVNVDKLKVAMNSADAVIIGAGAGLSTAAGFIYNGERFEKYFFDFAKRYGFDEMYTGGFYPYEKKEIFWAYWARYIYINRYLNPPKDTYDKLYDLIKDKDYFVITTNVDHCFQKAKFDKKRLFYTQGDYGLFQSVNPKIRETFDNEDWVMEAMEAQGFEKNEAGVFVASNKESIKMEIPSDLIPKCPIDNSDVTTNLRVDDSFVEDDGWRKASNAYADFLRRHEGLKVLYLELGVGSNTPVIIKYPFWEMTDANEKATYACINYGESYSPVEIEDRSICIDADVDEILYQLLQN